jgi:hypothetical protein
MKACTYCGRENEDTTVLCKECGTNLQVSVADSSTQTSIRHRFAELVGRMSTKEKRVIVCIGMLLAVVVTYRASDHWHRPQMSEVEVIQVANAAAVAKGFRLNEYRAPQARFEYPDRNRTWRVMYDLKLPTPWGPPIPKPQSAHGAPRHIFVIVDDKTRHTRVGMFRAVGAAQPIVPPPGVKVLGRYTNEGWSDSNAK